MPRIESSKCTSCALPLPAGETLCIECLANPLPVDWCESWGQYRDGLARLVQALKFERHDFLDDALAGLLDEILRDRDFDAITAIPMPKKKERRRGYNQAELLARALSRRTGIACDMTLLERRGDRAPQSTLSRRVDRAKNAKGAFASKADVKGKSILIVDDICTTAATLRAAAVALRKQGAGRVCAVTVARVI